MTSKNEMNNQYKIFYDEGKKFANIFLKNETREELEKLYEFVNIIKEKTKIENLNDKKENEYKFAIFKALLSHHKDKINLDIFELKTWRLAKIYFFQGIYDAIPIERVLRMYQSNGRKN